MNSNDPFALSFDSIRIDTPHSTPKSPEPEAPPSFADFKSFDSPGAPALAPLLFEQEAIPSATKPDGPGFYLLDDASGRFTIDHESGVVTLMHDHLMALEAGAIHPVHIKVIEPSGATYELNFRLRMTGRIPQIVGSEENDSLASLAAAPLLDLMSPVERAAGPQLFGCAWTKFAAVTENYGLLQRLGNERETYGKLIEPPPFAGYLAEPGQFALAAPPPVPAPAYADWAV